MTTRGIGGAGDERQRLAAILVESQRKGAWTEMTHALRQLAELESTGTRRARYLYTLASIHETKQENRRAARAALREALELDPGLADARIALQRLERSHASERRRGRRVLVIVAVALLVFVAFGLWRRSRASILTPAAERHDR
jgi:hypothetical protein